MKTYTIITNNDGALNSRTIESSKSLKKVCESEYKALLNSYDGLDECEVDEWETEDKKSYTLGATIDYCMGHEYIHDISVKVEAL